MNEANERRITEIFMPKENWTKDEQAKFCTDCKGTFDVINRRHHCRMCGNIFHSKYFSPHTQSYFLGVPTISLLLHFFISKTKTKSDFATNVLNIRKNISGEAQSPSEGSASPG